MQMRISVFQKDRFCQNCSIFTEKCKKIACKLHHSVYVCKVIIQVVMEWSSGHPVRLEQISS